MTLEPKLSIFTIVDDPLVRQMMDADGVRPAELAALLAAVAERLAKSETRSRDEPAAGPGQPTTISVLPDGQLVMNFSPSSP